VTTKLIVSLIVMYCIVSIHLYSASCSAHQSEALPVRETQREESSCTVRKVDVRKWKSFCELTLCYKSGELRVGSPVDWLPSEGYWQSLVKY